MRSFVERQLYQGSPLRLEDYGKRGTKQAWTFLNGHIYPTEGNQYVIGSPDQNVGTQLIMTANLDDSVWLIENKGSINTTFF